jgi:hypothetical protein
VTLCCKVGRQVTALWRSVLALEQVSNVGGDWKCGCDFISFISIVYFYIFSYPHSLPSLFACSFNPHCVLYSPIQKTAAVFFSAKHQHLSVTLYSVTFQKTAIVMSVAAVSLGHLYTGLVNQLPPLSCWYCRSLSAQSSCTSH